MGAYLREYGNAMPASADPITGARLQRSQTAEIDEEELQEPAGPRRGTSPHTQQCNEQQRTGTGTATTETVSIYGNCI